MSGLESMGFMADGLYLKHHQPLTTILPYGTTEKRVCHIYSGIAKQADYTQSILHDTRAFLAACEEFRTLLG